MTKGADTARVPRGVKGAVEGLHGAGFLGIVALLAALPISCTDFFWHLVLGRVIANEHRIPDTDLFSAVHPDAPYVQPQWLWELLAALVHEQAGLLGIRIAQAVLLAASFAGLWLVLVARTRRSSLAWLAVTLALVLFVDRFRARPDSLTLGFFVLLLPVLLAPNEGAARFRAVYVFCVAILWANLHGGASVLLLLSLGALWLGTLVDVRVGTSDRLAAARSLQVLVSATGGLLLSPTLLPGLLHWARLIGPQIETGNEEWLPTYTMLRYGVTPVTLLVATLPTAIGVAYVAEQALLLQRHGRAAVRCAEWLLTAGYLALSELAVRNAFLCLLPVAFMAQRAAVRPERRAASVLALVVSYALVGAVLDDVVVRSLSGFDRTLTLLRSDLSQGAYPEQAGDFLAEAGLEGGIFNEGAWGGYLIFRCWPACHVFVDTRQDLTPEMWDVFLASRSAEQRTAALEHAFRAWGVELAVFRGPTFALIAAPETWQLLYKAGEQEVYQRRGGAHERENLAHAQRWLTAHGASSSETLHAAAVRVGAATWLGLPEQRLRRAEAQADRASADVRVRQRGELAVAELAYRAGLYVDAVRAFASATALGPLPVREGYLAALSSFASGDRDGARRGVESLRGADLSPLSRRQRERLRLLTAELASGDSR